MKYYITYSNTDKCDYVTGSKNLIAWLKANKEKPIEDIRKMYSNWKCGSETVLDKYKKYLDR